MAAHGAGGVSIQKVEIVVSSNQDPARVAELVKEQLDRRSFQRVSSPRINPPAKVTFMQRLRFRFALFLHRVAYAISG